MIIHRKARTLSLALGLGLALGSSQLAWANYLLQPGDVLQLTAMGTNSIDRRAAVDSDGYVSFPLIGSVKAAGQTVTSLQQLIGQKLSQKIIHIITPDGRDVQTAVNPDDVSVTVAEYTPVYVSGDVTTPGAQSFRPGLTVRQAVSIAGGYGLVRGQADSILRGVDAMTDVQSLQAAAIREKVRLAGLKAELRLDSELKLDEPLPSNAFTSSIINLATQRLLAQLQDYKQQKAYLQAVADQTKTRVATLEKQQTDEQEGVRLDGQEANRVQDLLTKGMVNSDRATNARRMSLLSTTSALQTGADLATAQKDLAEYLHQIDAYESSRRSNLSDLIQASMVTIADLEAKIRGAQAKSTFVGGLNNGRSMAALGKDILIFRKGNDTPQKIVADEDMVLAPGDSVEITLHKDAFDSPTL
jgi:polysaccharide biosynthesis/export protein